MKALKILRNYFCYCGIDKNEFKKIQKDAYISNFEVWRILHCLMAVVFASLSITSIVVDIIKSNMLFYLLAFLYSIVVASLFLFVLRKDSLIAQLLIYLSITVLFFFGCFITQNNPNSPAATFMVLLIITPMFMIDKPYFMTIELIISSIVFLIWMYNVKPYVVWEMDLVNILVYTFVGIFLHMISNSIRIKEFVLSRKMKIQKDTDDQTGLKNKGALTREINEYLADKSRNEGIMFLLDIDHFKSVNDTYGHDVGDSVINQLGRFLREIFTNDEIVGRFGGDEFIVFIKDTNNLDTAKVIAKRIIDGASKHIHLPNRTKIVEVSIGIALYSGLENNYSEIFKKADIALYRTKTNRKIKYDIYQDIAQ